MTDSDKHTMLDLDGDLPPHLAALPDDKRADAVARENDARRQFNDMIDRVAHLTSLNAKAAQ